MFKNQKTGENEEIKNFYILTYITLQLAEKN